MLGFFFHEVAFPSMLVWVVNLSSTNAQEKRVLLLEAFKEKRGTMTDCANDERNDLVLLSASGRL